MAMKMAKWTGAFKNSWEHFLLYRDGFLAGQRSKWSAGTDHQPSNQVCVGLLLHATNRRWLGSSAPFYIARLRPLLWFSISYIIRNLP
jgi:hypothetical protein